MKLLIIIPAFNESENIVRVIEELKHKVPRYDYVIVNETGKSVEASEKLYNIINQ